MAYQAYHIQCVYLSIPRPHWQYISYIPMIIPSLEASADHWREHLTTEAREVRLVAQGPPVMLGMQSDATNKNWGWFSEISQS